MSIQTAAVFAIALATCGNASYPWVCSLDLSLDLFPGFVPGNSEFREPMDSSPGFVIGFVPWICSLDLFQESREQIHRHRWICSMDLFLGVCILVV